jgi:hypothetical protein
MCNMSSCQIRSVEDDFSLAFAGVYDPNIEALRSSLWDELAGLSSWWELPWCIGGNFNVTCFPAKRFRDVRLNAAMMEFSDLIFEQGSLRGLIIRRILLGLALINLLFLRIGKLSFQDSVEKAF